MIRILPVTQPYHYHYKVPSYFDVSLNSLDMCCHRKMLPAVPAEIPCLNTMVKYFLIGKYHAAPALRVLCSEHEFRASGDHITEISRDEAIVHTIMES